MPKKITWAEMVAAAQRAAKRAEEFRKMYPAPGGKRA